MESRIKAIRFAMNEEDKYLVGEEIFDLKGLDEKQKYAIYQGIDSYKAYAKLLDTSELNYVVDEFGNEGIIPALYNEYISIYNLTEAYFHDMLPTLYEIRLMEKDQIGIIYFLCEIENQQYIFLNEDAVNILKPMSPEEITNYVKEAQKSKKR